MTLLFTGASGFLGKLLYPSLKNTYSITTIGTAPANDIHANLASAPPTLSIHFDYVLHAAGKAHMVPKTKAEKQLFFDVNLQGTKNLCAALEKSGMPKAFIYISTVAVYGLSSGMDIEETHPLNGTSPYAVSKRMAEEFLIEWCKKHDVKLSILRPSLIAGANPPGSLGSMIHGIKNGQYLSITGGKARKSVLMYQDIANLIPLLIKKGGIYNVCDNHHPSFKELEETISKQLGKSVPFTIPYWMAYCMARIGNFLGNKAPINSDKLRKITKTLTFSNEKAKRELGWEPLDVLANFRVTE